MAEDYAASSPVQPLPTQPPQSTAPSNQSAIDLMIQQAAQQYNIDPAIFRAQLMHESGLNPNASGPGGEIGIAQFQPATAQAFGIDPRDPKQAIPAAALFMRKNLNQFGGDYTKALGAYASGPGAVATQGMANLPGASRYAATVLSMAGKGPGGGGGQSPVGAMAPGAPGGAPVGSPLASTVAPGAAGPPAMPAGPPVPALPGAIAGVMPGSMPGQPMSLADAFTQAAQRAMQSQQTQTGIG